MIILHRSVIRDVSQISQVMLLGNSKLLEKDYLGVYMWLSYRIISVFFVFKYSLDSNEYMYNYFVLNVWHSRIYSSYKMCIDVCPKDMHDKTNLKTNKQSKQKSKREKTKKKTYSICNSTVL